MSFAHLKLHTEYSLVDGVIRIPGLMHAVAESGMPAVALTDEMNLFGMLKFYRAALRQGIKPIIGADVAIAQERPGKPAYKMTLLCQDSRGYRNLTELLSRGWLQGQVAGRARLHRDWLTHETAAGLIALSGGASGEIGAALSAGNDSARQVTEHWARVFDDRFYIELQRCDRAGDEAHVRRAVRLASDMGLPVVATNDARFTNAADYEAHETRVCIQQGYTLNDGNRPRHYTPAQYLKSPGEMAELFADLPEALTNAVEIARRCNLTLDLKSTHLPEYVVPVATTPSDYLRDVAAKELAQRLESRGITDAAPYDERLAREIGVIDSMGFAGYFLIVADFVRWARDNSIPVGPGRGSGAGSLVAYALGITGLDPIEHELLFERFLNPERVSMPDFDIDFCMEGRDRVIEYVAERYGRDRVSQIITYGTMAARAVVRDVGRVLGHPYLYVDRIAKLIPFEIGMTLERALEQDEELKRQYAGDDEVRTLIDLARSLEGLARNAGKHAGGVVIAPSPLTDFTPLYCEEGGRNIVTQFDKDDVEAMGLVKFDFLGLRTLTIIDKAVATINRGRAASGERPLDIDTVPMDDAKTFSLLKRCDTTAVFQLESRGMRDLIKRLRPDTFDEIVALVALFRPGPLQSGMVEDFIQRKHDKAAPVDYLHPDLEPLLRPTYGVILYQEQVMQIAQVLSGYTLGGADLLRRAMGKKKPEEMAKQRSVFVDGAVERGVSSARASHIFDLIEKFAGYGFNKSHSAAYAVLSYQTAYLKAHYPAAFMAAVLSADMDHTDKIVGLIDDCKRQKIGVLPPDVNGSAYNFEPADEATIRYGLGAIKGVGRSAVDALIEEREANGDYGDLDNLCRRVDLHRVNRRTLESLIRAGAADALGPNRATLLVRLPVSLKLAEQHEAASRSGQTNLFGGGSPAAGASPVPCRTLPDLSDAERLAGERETLGLFLTGHPIEEFADDLAALTNGTLRKMKSDRPASGFQAAASRRSVTAAGLVIDIRRRGKRVTLILDDRSERLEVMVYDDLFQSCRNVIARDAVLLIEGTLRFDEFIDDWRLVARNIVDIDEARARHAGRLVINWQQGNGSREAGMHFVEALKSALRPYRSGSCTVQLRYMGGKARASLALGDEWRVRPTRELLHKLTDLVGRDGVRLVYPPRVARKTGGEPVGV